MLNGTTGADIQKYNYCTIKAKQNDIEIIVEHGGFVLTRNSDSATLGKIETVEGMFQYLCGYEVGLDKGLVDSAVI